MAMEMRTRLCTLERPNELVDMLNLDDLFTALSFQPKTGEMSALLLVGDGGMPVMMGDYPRPLGIVISTAGLLEMAERQTPVELIYDADYANLLYSWGNGARLRVVELERLPMGAWRKHPSKLHRRPTIVAMLQKSIDANGAPRYTVNGRNLLIRTPDRMYQVTVDDLIAEVMEKELINGPL
jgi:hypothetical protein